MESSLRTNRNSKWEECMSMTQDDSAGGHTLLWIPEARYRSFNPLQIIDIRAHTGTMSYSWYASCWWILTLIPNFLICMRCIRLLQPCSGNFDTIKLPLVWWVNELCGFSTGVSAALCILACFLFRSYLHAPMALLFNFVAVPLEVRFLSWGSTMLYFMIACLIPDHNGNCCKDNMIHPCW